MLVGGWCNGVLQCTSDIQLTQEQLLCNTSLNTLHQPHPTTTRLPKHSGWHCRSINLLLLLWVVLIAGAVATCRGAAVGWLKMKTTAGGLPTELNARAYLQLLSHLPLAYPSLRRSGPSRHRLRAHLHHARQPSAACELGRHAVRRWCRQHSFSVGRAQWAGAVVGAGAGSAF